MTITQIIALIGIVLSASVALIVAYLHRKQMRQIELYKQDPSVGLVPSPSRLTAFVKSKWDSIFAYGGPIYILVSQLLTDSPVTRLSVLLIALAMGMLVLNINLSLIYRVQSKFNDRIMKLLDFDERQLAITKEIVEHVFPDKPNA